MKKTLPLSIFTIQIQSGVTNLSIMFKSPFSFEGRIRRLEYGISLIIQFVAPIILNEIAQISEGAVIVLFIHIPLLLFIFAQGAKRCHDIGYNGWWQIVPLFGLWMLFEGGHIGTNKYGPDPKSIGNPKPTTEDKKTTTPNGK